MSQDLGHRSKIAACIDFIEPFSGRRMQQFSIGVLDPEISAVPFAMLKKLPLDVKSTVPVTSISNKLREKRAKTLTFYNLKMIGRVQFKASHYFHIIRCVGRPYLTKIWRYYLCSYAPKIGKQRHPGNKTQIIFYRQHR